MIFMCNDRELVAHRRGITLVEITIALTVFTVVMLPVLMTAMHTTRQTFSMEKHLVASRFAAGILDGYMSMPFNECRKAVAAQTFPKAVADEIAFQKLAESDADFGKVVEKTFHEFVYDVLMKESDIQEEFGQMFTLTVNVYRPSSPGSAAVKSFSLSAVKFNEHP